MSAKALHRTHSQSADRRVGKTRAALLASFDRLVLVRGYDNLSVRELTACADIGRSTFYEHFETKDDLLEQSIAPLVAIFGDAAATAAPSNALREVLRHLLEHRALGARLLQGATRDILIRVLARSLERHLAAVIRRYNAPPIAPLPFLAVSLAHAQLGTIDAWLATDGRCDVATAARVLHATTRAGVVAMCIPSR